MDRITKEQRSKVMSSIRSVSMLEILARNSLKGLRLRHQPKGIYGNPDFANQKRRIAVFINGCFFHQPCPLKCSKIPKSNINFWKKKFMDNRARQRKVIRALTKDNWVVIVIWEHEIRGKR